MVTKKIKEYMNNETAVAKEEGIKKKTGNIFIYKRLKYKFLSEVLGTCTEVELYNEHVLKKAQKEIKAANALHNKIIKSLDKYKGTKLTPEKEFEELKAVLRAYQERVGKRDELPDNLEDLLEYSKEVAKDYEEMLSRGETQKSTVFMRDTDGWPIISTHMVVGNFKENLKSIINNSPAKSKAITSKVSVGEVMATDVKVVEDFVRPSLDLVRKPDGTVDILERPIHFNFKGETKSAIAMSEYLPAGTEIEFTLRIRAVSPVLEVLDELLEMGKNNGIGQWRGSGKKGNFMYKMEDCDEPVHPFAKDGWK
jgi:hypothetical protein